MISATGERRAIDHIESSIGPWYRVTWKDRSQAPVEYSIVGAGRGADGGERLTIALKSGLPWHPCRPDENASLDNITQQGTHGDARRVAYVKRERNDRPELYQQSTTSNGVLPWRNLELLVQTSVEPLEKQRNTPQALLAMQLTQRKTFTILHRRRRAIPLAALNVR
jgi:hypothetical protein